jgi:perosamine synthetase
VIPYGRQLIDADDRAAVDAVLTGDWLTQGPHVEAFEESVASYVHAKFAIAFSSGTSALHASAAAAGLGPGDLLVSSPLTFMASVNCARYVGATPGLVDIDRNTCNIDLNKMPLEAAAVVPVHYAGLPVDLTQMKTRPRIVIEDAAHALGAHTPSGPVGNCAHSDMTCFSFHPVKPVTTAEGGIVTTNNAELAERLRTFRSHGIVKRPDKGSWYYEISELGYHYRLSDLQAALGVSQMRKLDKYIDIRHEIADRYRSLLANDESIALPASAPAGFRHGHHLFTVQLEQRDVVFEKMRERGIFVQVHYVPVHHHPISADISVLPGSLANCDYVYERIMSLPVHPSLTGEEQDFVVDSLRELVAEHPSISAAY